MNYKVIVSEKAENHLNNAVEWYENEKAGLGVFFLVSVKECIRFLITNPFAFVVVYKKIRKVNIKKYPYSLYYKINKEDNELLIIAVLHTSRSPEILNEIFKQAETK